MDAILDPADTAAGTPEALEALLRQLEPAARAHLCLQLAADLDRLGGELLAETGAAPDIRIRACHSLIALLAMLGALSRSAMARRLHDRWLFRPPGADSTDARELAAEARRLAALVRAASQAPASAP
jgi:hypothetical protein